MGTRLVLLFCFAVTFASAVHGSTTQLWVWRDANGVTHYSDRPVPGAKPMSIATMEPARDVRPVTPPPVTSRATTVRPPASTVEYSLLEIFQPASDETFFGADAVVDVRIRSEPDLAAEDQMRLYLDGELIARTISGTEYSLSGLDRGAHKMTAQIVDAQGKAKILSEPVVFHIRQETVGVPARAQGPSLRPPPPPKPTPKPGGSK